MHAPPVGVVHQAVHRVMQRAPFRPPGVKQRHIRRLARLYGADYVIHPQRRRAPYRAQFQRRLRRHHPHILPPVLVQRRRQIHRPQRFQQVGIVAGVRAQSCPGPGGQQFRQASVPGHSGPAFDGGRRTHHHAGAPFRNQPRLVVPNPQAVGQRHCRPQRAALLQILGRRNPARLPAFLNPPRPVVEMQRGPRPPGLRDFVARRQQLRRAVLRRKGHRPRRNHSRQRSVVPGDGVLRYADGLVRAVHRQVERVLPVLHAAPDHNAAAGLPVRFQADVQMGRAARIHKGCCAVLQQLRYRQQRSGEFVLRRHCRLQPEHIRQIVRPQIVGKQPPHRVGVADVHMPVHKTRRHHHSAGVNHPFRRNPRQFRRLAHPRNAPVRYHHRTVGDNPAFRVHGYDVTRPFDFQRSLCLHPVLRKKPAAPVPAIPG